MLLIHNHGMNLITILQRSTTQAAVKVEAERKGKHCKQQDQITTTSFRLTSTPVQLHLHSSIVLSRDFNTH